MRTVPCRWRDRVAGPAVCPVRSYGARTGDGNPAPGADLSRLSTVRSAPQTSYLHPPTRLTIVAAFGLTSEVMAHYGGRARSRNGQQSRASCHGQPARVLGVPHNRNRAGATSGGLLV